MNRLIIYGSVDAIPFYNCSWKSSEEWWATGVKRPLLGISTVIAGVLIELLYIPVIYIMFKTKLVKLACYKLMVLLAISDMNATVCSSLITGTLLAQGAVFCSYPRFIYTAGIFILSTWCCSCAITVSLFLNRIVSIVFKKFTEGIETRMAYLSMTFSILYMIYFTFFTAPPIFNSSVLAWIPNPLSEQEPSEEATLWYENYSQLYNNWGFPISIIILFTVYCIIVKKLARGQKSKAAISIFIQCSLIGVFNTFISLVYSSLTLAPWIMVFCQVSWTINHGLPAVIYVTMNDTIRREFKKLILGRGSYRVDEKRSSLANLNSTNSRI